MYNLKQDLRRWSDGDEIYRCKHFLKRTCILYIYIVINIYVRIMFLIDISEYILRETDQYWYHQVVKCL